MKVQFTFIINIILTTSIVLFLGATAMAQKPPGILRGQILDKEGRGLSGTSIQIPALKRMVTTRDSGYFELDQLPLGSYQLKVELVGYIAQFPSITVGSNMDSLIFTLQRDTTELGSVSVYGFSKVKAAGRQAYNVTSVDAIKFHNSTMDVAHVLDRVPGARLRETGGLGSNYDFSISGFSGKRVRFFLDGMPMESFGPAFQINNIPINLAQRIEVYKGVIPIWLGSDALGGAVNIITDSQGRNYLDASYSYGSFGTHKTNINAAVTSKKGFTFRLNAFQNYSNNDYKVKVNVADIHSGKYTKDTTVRRFHDRYHNETAIIQTGFVGRRWADQLLLGVTIGQYYKQIQTGPRSEAVFGGWYTKGNILMPSLKYSKRNLFVKGLDASLYGTYNGGKDQSIDTVHARYNWVGDSVHYRGNGGENWYSLYKYRNHALNTALTLKYRIGKRHLVALNDVYNSFNRTGQNLVSPHSQLDNIPQKTSKNFLGFSYQYDIADKWSLTTFGKYLHQGAGTTLIQTDIQHSGDTTYQSAAKHMGRLGYGLATSYFISPEVQLKFSYEKTYRLPESEDLFGDIVSKEGNWNLKPESSHNVNLGVHVDLPIGEHRISMDAAGIYYYAHDFIYYLFNSYTNKLYGENLLKVSNLGLQSEIHYSYKKIFTAGISATYQNIRNREKYRTDLPTDQPVLSTIYQERIPNTPYLFGSADASLFLDDLFCGGDRLSICYNLLYVHDFYLYWATEGAKETKRTIPTQFSHDLSLIYAFKGGRYNIALEGHNLTNEALYDDFSLQKPGRAFQVKLRYFIH